MQPFAGPESKCLNLKQVFEISLREEQKVNANMEPTFSSF